MSRELKTNGIYKITCVVTGETAGTTPKVFEDRASRYGVDIKSLKSNYVGRTAAKAIKHLVGVKGMSPAKAVTEVRSAFGVKNDNAITPAVLNHVVAGLTAKKNAAKAAKAFEANKAKALEALMS